MNITKKNGYARLEFDSCQDIMDYLDKHNFKDATSRQHGSAGFCTYSWDECKRFLRSGWSEGVTHVDNISKNLKGTLTDSETYNIQYDVAGDYIDMGRYITGEPECFGNVISEPMPMDGLKVMIDTCFSSSVKQDAIYNRGAAITTIIDELQKQYFLTVSLAARIGANSKMSEDIELIFNIDMKNEYSRDLLAFYTANTGFFRRICFAIMEVYYGKASLGGYGHVHELPKKHDEILFPAGSGEVNMKYMNTETTTDEIKRVLEKYQK